LLSYCFHCTWIDFVVFRYTALTQTNRFKKRISSETFPFNLYFLLLKCLSTKIEVKIKYKGNPKKEIYYFLYSTKDTKEETCSHFSTQSPSLSSHLLLQSTSFLMPSVKNDFRHEQRHICTVSLTLNLFIVRKLASM
jgi:hypothetical protein